jgi:hypothetical protein
MRVDRHEAHRELAEARRELARLRRIRGAYGMTWRRIARARKRLAFAAALLAAAQADPAAAVPPLFQHGFVFPDSVSGDSFVSPTLADIDGDGDLDAIVSGSSGSTHFFANTGSPLHPVFPATPVKNPFGLFDIGDRSFTSFGDIDADGDLDAFVGNVNGTTFFFRNTGTPSAPVFPSRVVNPFGLTDVGSSSTPTPVDLDGDGDLDLAIGNYGGDTLVFINTGTPAAPVFAAPLTNPFGLARNGRAARPAFADLDGDGDGDAFIGSQQFAAPEQLHWFENTGSATSPAFAAPVAHPFGLVHLGGPASVSFGDVDADGDLDALASGGPSLMVPFENTGTASAPAFEFDGNPFDLAIPGSPTAATIESAPAFADVDADGDLDSFLGPRFTGELIFARNTGGPSSPSFTRDPANPWELAGNDPTLADIDGDGDVDAFVGTFGGEVLFHENTGGADVPLFAPRVANPFGLTTVGFYASPMFTDIDGDGDLDAFIGHWLGDTVFFENTGSVAAPAFAAGVVNPFGLASVGFDASPSFGDFDSDGDLDGFFGHADGNFVLFENTGTTSAPAFAAPVTNPGAPTLYDIGERTTPQLVDLDGDGDLDLVAGRASQATTLFTSVGTPSAPFFHGAYTNRFGSDGTNTAPALEDLDGDGDLDALVGRSNDPNLLLVRNLGTPSAARFVAADAVNPFGFTAGRPQLVDIDADGDLDAFFGREDGQTQLFANVGTPSEDSFSSAVFGPFGLTDVGSRAIPTFGDIDADGDLDAAIGNSSGATLWFTNTGTPASPSFAPPTTNPFGLTTVPSNAAPLLADVDGDGDLDALVGDSQGNMSFFANTGTASAPAFAAPTVNPFGLARGGRDAVPTLADHDGDGDLDGFVGDGRGRVLFFENVVVDADACTDGVDNDGDGRADLGADAGCADTADTSELSAQQCDNGLDDDGDGEIDWRGDASGDPHCANLADDREAPDPPPGCGLGPELLPIAALLLAVRRRRGSYTARSCPSASPTRRPTSSSSGAR